MRPVTNRSCAFLFFIALVLAGCQVPGPPRAEPVARQFAAAWERSDYPAMWELLTPEAQEQFGTKGFIERLPLIAAEMTLIRLRASVGEATSPTAVGGSPDPARATVPIQLEFETQRVGTVESRVDLHLVLSGEKERAVWKINWAPTSILPDLVPGRLVRMTRLPTSRGRIIARDGTELATFVEAVVVGVVPGQIVNEGGLLTSLSAVTQMSADQIKALLGQSWVRPDSFVPIKTLSAAAAQEARVRLSLIQGVQTRTQRVRSYPTGLAAQTIGYVGPASDVEAKAREDRGVGLGDVIGKTGLEATLDDLIGGSQGWRLSIVESDERPVKMLGETPPEPGLDAVLALDPVLQRAAEAALGDQRGAIVAEDPWTGEVHAIVSRPSFDLNAFVTTDTSAIAAFNSDPRRPLFNRSTNGQYATGSAFKMVTAAAALKHGLLSPRALVDCPYQWSGFGPQWVQINHETADLGPIDLRTALARSCNSFFYELGKRLDQKDRDLLPNAAKSFGLGSATDIEFVFEAEGLVPSVEWKAQRFANDPALRGWNPGDATNLAIGQGYLLATPLQMANYAAALANDGIVWQPRLVIELRDRQGATVRTFEKKELGRVDNTPQDLSFIRDGMRAVVSDPVGTVFFPFQGFPTAVAGKSGTAETTAGAPNAWFVGFAPFDSPRLAFATVFEEKPGLLGSQDAATATRAMLAARFP